MNKKILITGASRGIGKALAYEYAKQGCELYLMARNETHMKEICDEINAAGGKAYFRKCDVTKTGEVKEAVEDAIMKLMRIDIAYLNAGVSGASSLADSSIDELKTIFGVNVFGITHGMEYIVPQMKKQGGGTIVGVSSLADARGFPRSGPYSASKAAASHLLEAARIELKSDNINVVNVRPGFVETDMTDLNDFYMPMLMDVSKAAKIIVERVEKGRKRIAFPWPVALGSAILKHMPSFIFIPLMTYWYKNMRGKKKD